jgi:flagellar biogenesis protein FliO
MENMYVQVIRVILALVAIVAAMYAFSRFGGKLMKFNLKPKETPYGLKKAEMIHLGYKKFVSVVEVKDRVLVIGMGEKELTLLSQWTKEDKEI